MVSFSKAPAGYRKSVTVPQDPTPIEPQPEPNPPSPIPDPEPLVGEEHAFGGFVAIEVSTDSRSEARYRAR